MPQLVEKQRVTERENAKTAVEKVCLRCHEMLRQETTERHSFPNLTGVVDKKKVIHFPLKSRVRR